VVPVGLYAEPFDGDELALDAEQPLDDALRSLVAPFAEAVVADDAVRVDEVERRPAVVGDAARDHVAVVDRDRSLLRRLPHAVDLVLERELPVLTPMTITRRFGTPATPHGRWAPGAAS
jgi:hypothetical protein